MDDEVADVLVDEEAEVAGQDFVQVAMADGDPVEVAQCAVQACARKTPGHAETVFRRYSRG